MQWAHKNLVQAIVGFVTPPRVYLFGAKKEVLEALRKVLSQKYPDLSVVGCCDGYVSDKDAVFEEIQKLGPDLILVALGVPQQEELIYRHFKKFSKGIFVGVGGSFDKVAYLAKHALLRPIDVPNPDPYYAEMDRELLEEINKLGVGPQGFGGRTTCLGLSIETMPTHVASLPVAVNVSCHVTRRASATL